MLFNIEPRGRGGAGLCFLIKFFCGEVACMLAVEPTLNLRRKREGQDGGVGQKDAVFFSRRRWRRSVPPATSVQAILFIIDAACDCGGFSYLLIGFAYS